MIDRDLPINHLGCDLAVPEPALERGVRLQVPLELLEPAQELDAGDDRAGLAETEVVVADGFTLLAANAHVPI